MKRLVEFDVSDASIGSLIVEVDETAPDYGGEDRAGHAGQPQRAQRSLDEALERVRPAATVLVEKLRSLAEPPDEATIEFGIKLTGTAGAILASAALEANYHITLTWRRG